LRILEPLIDFKFSYEVYNLGLKAFKKALSSNKILWRERERERERKRELFESFQALNCKLKNRF
jgi:hypothetical protein